MNIIQKLEAHFTKVKDLYPDDLPEYLFPFFNDLEANIIRDVKAAIPRWISVEDAFPKDDEDVLVYGEKEGIGVEQLGFVSEDGELWFSHLGYCHGYRQDVTHWMPLPAPPVV
jgi:hypothetical protein